PAPPRDRPADTGRITASGRLPAVSLSSTDPDKMPGSGAGTLFHTVSMPQHYALISVYDKEGLEPLVAFFRRQGIELLSSGGTWKRLSDAGEKVHSISDYTQSPEILDGRVKTLHPRVHGGILARRDNPQDLKEIESIGAGLIDYVVVNLYPFPAKLRE